MPALQLVTVWIALIIVLVWLLKLLDTVLWAINLRRLV